MPAASLLRALALTWPLRGADRWHLAMAKTLQADLPELIVLTYDNRLAEAGERFQP